VPSSIGDLRIGDIIGGELDLYIVEVLRATTANRYFEYESKTRSDPRDSLLHTEASLAYRKSSCDDAQPQISSPNRDNYRSALDTSHEPRL
jgi:hypothetical protein